MASGFRFDRFSLDPADRRLACDGEPVELNGRYLDALSLLVREQGRLVTKERFHDEVWRGIPVTDEALTQCIRTLRRQLGDDAARPRFIETVPKHGYRFIAPVEDTAAAPAAARADRPPARGSARERFLLLGGAGTAGAGLAGAIGGLFYGFAGAGAGGNAVSALLVLLCITVAMATAGGAGVSFGVAATAAADPGGRLTPAAVLGGAAGGILVGAAARLIGLDAFNLLFGRAPADMTGAPEGALLGAAAGLGAWLASKVSLRRGVALAGAIGAGAGAAIPLLGGHMLSGSLELLARSFPQSRLQLDQAGGLFGEPGFGLAAHVLTGALEGGLFAACIAGAITLATRRG